MIGCPPTAKKLYQIRKNWSTDLKVEGWEQTNVTLIMKGKYTKNITT
jgi:hypothetical protein